MNSHFIEEPSGGDFKFPQPNQSGNQGSTASVDADSGKPYALPLKTPDRRPLSADNASFEVRKRLLSPMSSPTDDCKGCNSNEGKRRHVAKSLFEDAETEMKSKVHKSLKSSRCLFGPPSHAGSDRILQDFYEKEAKEYKEFIRRYEIVEELQTLK